MKFFVIAKRKEDINKEEISKHLELEAKMAIQLFKEEFIRELYSIKGGKGACMVIEANDEDEIITKLSTLPLVKYNYLNIDIIEVKPYRGF